MTVKILCRFFTNLTILFLFFLIAVKYSLTYACSTTCGTSFGISYPDNGWTAYCNGTDCNVPSTIYDQAIGATGSTDHCGFSTGIYATSVLGNTAVSYPEGSGFYYWGTSGTGDYARVLYSYANSSLNWSNSKVSFRAFINGVQCGPDIETYVCRNAFAASSGTYAKTSGNVKYKSMSVTGTAVYYQTGASSSITVSTAECP